MRIAELPGKTDPLPDPGLWCFCKRYGTEHPLLKDNYSPESVSFKKLADHALNGCKISSHIVSKVCELLSEEIIRLTGLLNPNLIVLGGDITCRDELLTGYIMPRIRRKTSKLLKMGFVMPGIRYSSYGEFSVAMGATAMILSMILQSQNHKTR
jgi:predicted NBD/HSP70 family sugar kinase